MKGIVRLYDEDKKLIKEVGIDKLHVKEDKIIERSIKEFKDDSPCVIHRRACSIKILFELKEEIEEDKSYLIGEKIKVSELDKDILDVLDLGRKIKYIEFN